MSMGPRTSVQHSVLNASFARPSSSFGPPNNHVDLTEGVSFHLMPSSAEALIQQAVARVGTSKHVDSDPDQTHAALIWTPSSTKNCSSAGKIPSCHAKKSGWDKLKIVLPPTPPYSDTELPKLQLHNLLHSSPLSSPGKSSLLV
jgi:hypothetical protein